MSDKCRIDGLDLIPIIDIGDQFVSDFVDNPQDGEKSSLKMGIGQKSGLVQLYESFSPEKMYRKYWYRSGINESMVSELKNIVDSANKFTDVKTGETVLDIASNDHTLLSFWNKDLIRIGIDPVKNMREYNKDAYNYVVEDFFSSENYWSVAKEKSKVITSIAMFYDIENPNWFCQEIKKCLHDNGVWILQLSYLPLMLEQNAFDNIVAEHIEYYSFTVLNNLLKNNGFRVFDVELNDTNSGSCRVYITHANNRKLKSSYHYQQIGQFRVNSLLEYENKLNLLSPDPYIQFSKRIEDNKNKTMTLLNELKNSGKKVIGYGASTKGNTLLQYYGIDSSLISCIAERSSEKWGKKTIGTGIPIISEEEMRKLKPDFLFIFPWHFVDGFLIREKELRNYGTKFIVPLPYVEII